MQQAQRPEQGLPETIRVKVLRGFRGHIDGRFGAAFPGDVVEIPRALAMEMRGAGRAVMTDAEPVRQKNYLPERKKSGLPADPVLAQLAGMTKAFEGMQKLIEQLAPAKK